MSTAVVYCRISEDKSEKAVAVDRQEALCREYAETHGYSVTNVYVDNSISATTGKRRPAFERMLADRPPAIIVWAQDRLIRLTKELERVIELDVPVLTVNAGMIDLATPQGRAVARTVAAWSTYEGEQKAKRQGVATADLVAKGEPVPGKRRFGFLGADPNATPPRRVNSSMHPDEGPQVQALFRDYLGGESIVQLAKRMSWRTLRVRETLSNPGYAGWIVHRGTVYPAASHIDRLVSQEDFDAAQVRLRDRSAAYRGINTRGGQVRHLLSGIAVCGVCGGTLAYRNAYLCLRDLSHPTVAKKFVDGKVLDKLAEVFVDPAFRLYDDPMSASLSDLNQRLRVLADEKAETLAMKDDKTLGLTLADVAPTLRRIATEAAEVESQRDAALSQSLHAQILQGVVHDVAVTSSGQHILAVDPDAAKGTVRLRLSLLGLAKQRTLIRGMLDVVVIAGRGSDRVIVSAKQPVAARERTQAG